MRGVLAAVILAAVILAAVILAAGNRTVISTVDRMDTLVDRVVISTGRMATSSSEVVSTIRSTRMGMDIRMGMDFRIGMGIRAGRTIIRRTSRGR